MTWTRSHHFYQVLIRVKSCPYVSIKDALVVEAPVSLTMKKDARINIK